MESSQKGSKKHMTTAKASSIQMEMEDYKDWIQKFRKREIGPIKMQKIRLQLGTYDQRQEGVQMQRIKLPGGVMSSEQLLKLADVADQYASGFIHFTTREDAQLYYIQLEKCPDMMLDLASAGITTREACGNTVRNITACYRSGMSATEAFDIAPYSEALYQFLLRNKYNQVMGRKFKIAFESCQEDHAGMRYHDLGFQGVVKEINGKTKRGFRTYVGGGLGAVPSLGFLYTEFLPEEDLFNLAAAAVRLFDRYGERKNRMAARMKFLVKKMGWDAFKKALDEERKQVHVSSLANKYIQSIYEREKDLPRVPSTLPANPKGLSETGPYRAWYEDSVIAHKVSGFKGVHVRLRLGDLPTDQARQLAEIAKVFSHSELKISIEQNLFLPWVPEKAIPALYAALEKARLAHSGAETLEDTTTCPGADTCRLGITSAKGLGASISAAMENGMSRFKELARDIKVKISGCPNGCAQHGIANIGFQGAAVAKEGKTLPSHELFLGGSSDLDQTTISERIGKFPARNCVKVVENLLELYSKEKQSTETFNACMTRVGKDKIREVLAPLAEVPSFQDNPDFYQDWGHDNEKFAIRTGIKGECAGAPVQEKAPAMSHAKDKLSQAEAFLAHKEFASAQIEAYEAMAAAARVPLYANLVDPFTSEQALWEFENIFVRSGKVSQGWLEFADKVAQERDLEPNELRANALIELAKKYLAECEALLTSLLSSTPK